MQVVNTLMKCHKVEVNKSNPEVNYRSGIELVPSNIYFSLGYTIWIGISINTSFNIVEHHDGLTIYN